MVLFDWDPKKAASNLADHKVDFREAQTVFADPLSSELIDPRHDEERYVLYGRSSPTSIAPGDRSLVVVYAQDGETVRIISAREMEPHEKREYENQARRR